MGVDFLYVAFLDWIVFSWNRDGFGMSLACVPVVPLARPVSVLVSS